MTKRTRAPHAAAFGVALSLSAVPALAAGTSAPLPPGFILFGQAGGAGAGAGGTGGAGGNAGSNGTAELVLVSRSRGARATNGVGMLVHQAAHQFTLWTGVGAPVEVMAEAARAEMAKREDTGS